MATGATIHTANGMMMSVTKRAGVGGGGAAAREAAPVAAV